MKLSWNQCRKALRTKVLAIMAAGFIVLQTLASAQTFAVLHTFQQTDGANPRAALIQDSSGNLYSTTEFGGTQDAGTIFALSGTTLTSLYSFNSYPDGAWQ